MSGAFSSGDIDNLTTDRFSALGDMPVMVVDAARWSPPDVDIQAVVIGVDYQGTLPSIDPAHFDLLLTTVTDAPAPWVSVNRLDASVELAAKAVREWPMAATLFCQVLRLTEGLAFTDGLKIESLAYSTLLGGSEFARWKSGHTAQAIPDSEAPLVLVERNDDVVTLTLNHADAQNAMTAAMRDALHGALANILDDPSSPHVILKANGRCFSTGGALAEFGSASDIAEAHIVRTLRSVASLGHRLGDRASVRLHGACVGSGMEIPIAAAHRTATSNAWFQLPELRMGLIPGAGGSISVARAIGRHRTAWMLLSGKRIDARLAANWGLIQAIVD